MAVIPLDRAVWAAHLDPGLRLADIDPSELAAWAVALQAESRGYWHGMSGRLAERLRIDQPAWLAMVRIHQPEPPASIGNSSVDLVPEILRRSSKRAVCRGCLTNLPEVGDGHHQVGDHWCGPVFERDGGKTVPEIDWEPDPECAFCGGHGLEPTDPMGDRCWCSRCGPPYLPVAT